MNERKPLLYLNNKTIAGETAKPGSEETRFLQSFLPAMDTLEMTGITPGVTSLESSGCLGDLLSPENHGEGVWLPMMGGSFPLQDEWHLATLGSKEDLRVSWTFVIKLRGNTHTHTHKHTHTHEHSIIVSIPWSAKENGREILRLVSLHLNFYPQGSLERENDMAPIFYLINDRASNYSGMGSVYIGCKSEPSHNNQHPGPGGKCPVLLRTPMA